MPAHRFLQITLQTGMPVVIIGIPEVSSPGSCLARMKTKSGGIKKMRAS